MAPPINSSKPGSEAHMIQLENTRKQPTENEECFKTLKSICVVALGTIICGLSLILLPISIPIIGWIVHKQNVTEKVRTAAQQALPTTIAPHLAIEPFKAPSGSLYPATVDRKKLFETLRAMMALKSK
jgi:hypothetical protein